MRLKRILGFLVLCAGVSSLFIWQEGRSLPVSQAQPPPLPEGVRSQTDVPYVPTPNEVVTAMLKMASVTQDDVVYDLGSGDGRLVIAAAKEFGAKGVGFEINPRLIQESNEKARLASVSDRVKFVEQDLFQTDLSEATVVTLYLLPKVNVQLRPKLLRELKPGTPVVSHQFDMKEWKPDRTEVLRVGSRIHRVFYWVIPAQVTGTWQWNMQSVGSKNPYTLQLRQQFQEVTGTVRMSNEEMPITEAKLTGDQLSFKVTQPKQGKLVTMQFNGRISDNTIIGSVDILGGAKVDRRNWSARR
ncbi:class I SAM-dependent methyltransferase [Trichocoleus sp. DQ-A2]|uniref:methyltransferase domain-containing protein n=1 Tax=Trichocoleus sp. DQ-A2 TaxID=2933924 RepID=UPI0016854398|nr:class I SAM-dependent methyltransferase [Coleofasciculus sp. FACHB-T130]